jgi:hypothetical protein
LVRIFFGALDILTTVVVVFLTPSRQMPGEYLVGHNSILPNRTQFVVHLTFYHSALQYSYGYRREPPTTTPQNRERKMAQKKIAHLELNQNIKDHWYLH